MKTKKHTKIYEIKTPTVPLDDWQWEFKQGVYDGYRINTIRVSPDGKRILFSVDADWQRTHNGKPKRMIDKRHGLWVMNIDGKNIRKVFPEDRYHNVDWYPDSKHIIIRFDQYPDDAEITKEDYLCLFKYNIDNGDYKKVCYDQYISNFRLTSDGKYLYGTRLLLEYPAIMPIEGPNKGKVYIPFPVEKTRGGIKKYGYPYWWYDMKIDNIEDYIIEKGRKLTLKEAIVKNHLIRNPKMAEKL